MLVISEYASDSICFVCHIQVNEDEPVLQAFKLMRQKGVGGVPVVENGGSKAIGNISIRDIQFLLTAPQIYRDYRSLSIIYFLHVFSSEFITFFNISVKKVMNMFYA